MERETRKPRKASQYLPGHDQLPIWAGSGIYTLTVYTRSQLLAECFVSYYRGQCNTHGYSMFSFYVHFVYMSYAFGSTLWLIQTPWWFVTRWVPPKVKQGLALLSKINYATPNQVCTICPFYYPSGVFLSSQQYPPMVTYIMAFSSLLLASSSLYPDDTSLSIISALSH